jgi:hypothetical protein
LNESLKLLPFRPDQPPRRLIERFPDEQSMIESLWRCDREFREICRDYREAVASLCLAEERGIPEERQRSIAELVAELEAEMLAAVESHL